MLPLRQELQITPSYPYALAIFKSLLEYVTTSSYYKSYYDYRRNIYTFRNSYLAILLNVVIDYSKLLLHSWRADPANTHLLQYLRETILLLETLVMYPFTLNLHEYENDE